MVTLTDADLVVLFFASAVTTLMTAYPHIRTMKTHTIFHHYHYGFALIAGFLIFSAVYTTTRSIVALTISIMSLVIGATAIAIDWKDLKRAIKLHDFRGAALDWKQLTKPLKLPGLSKFK